MVFGFCLQTRQGFGIPVSSVFSVDYRTLQCIQKPRSPLADVSDTFLPESTLFSACRKSSPPGRCPSSFLGSSCSRPRFCFGAPADTCHTHTARPDRCGASSLLQDDGFQWPALKPAPQTPLRAFCCMPSPRSCGSTIAALMNPQHAAHHADRLLLLMSQDKTVSQRGAAAQ